MTYDLFVSYSRRDNTQGRITELVEQIASDYEQFAGEPLSYFFDVESIDSMDDWRHRILGGLRDSQLFLLMLSPGYLKSEYCEWEIVEYLKYEHGRAVAGQGVAPIYFVEIPGFADPDFEERAADWLARVRRRNWVDLRPWHDEGRNALRQQDVRARFKDLERSLSSRISRLRRIANAPGNLPAHNPAFVGREREMQHLHEAAGHGQLGVLAAVHGIGGLGKTALAIQYAYAYADFYPGGRWLIGCAGKPSLASAIRTLDIELGIEFSDEDSKDDIRAARRVLNRLRTLSEENAAAQAQETHPPAPCALLILDNVDEPSLLQPPESDLVQGLPWLHALATTRLGPDAFGYGEEPPSHAEHQFLAVDELPTEDALRLIESHQRGGRFTSDSDAEAARELVAVLGGFTLAVEVVAVYLGEHSGHISCKDFAERLRADGLTGLESVATGTRKRLRHAEKLLTVTLAPTFDSLSESQLFILRLTALLPPDTIALPWVRAVAGQYFSELVDDAPPGYVDPWLDAVNGLLGLRLLQVTDRNQEGTPRVGRIHRLVQAVVADRHHADATSLVSQLVDHAKSRLDFMARAWIDRTNAWEVDPLADYAAKLLASGHDEGPYVASAAGRLLSRLGRYATAEPLYRRTLEARERVLGNDHPDTLVSVGNLGKLLHDKGDYGSAEPMLQRALEGFERTLGNDHPDTLTSVNNLAAFRKDRGDYGAAEPLYRRALKARERVLGPTQPDTLVSAGNLARLLHDKGDYGSAEPMLQRVLEGFERAFGPNHPDTLTSVNNLAGLLHDRGDYGSAEAFYRRALEAREQVLGNDHPDTLVSVGNLAKLLHDKGDYGRAEPMFRRALEGSERVLGNDHPSTLASVGNLAKLLYDKGDHSRAEPMFRRTLVGFVQVFGPCHLDTLTSANNLAALLEKVDRENEAFELRRAVLEMCAKDSALSPRGTRQLALSAYECRDFRLARELLSRLLAFGLDVAGTHIHLSRVCLLTDDLEGARNHVAQAWEHRVGAARYVFTRILWMELLFVLLDDADCSLALGRLKMMLQSDDAFMEWTMKPVLAHLKPQLGDAAYALLTALVEALGKPDRVADLESFELWRNQAPIPFDLGTP